MNSCAEAGGGCGRLGERLGRLEGAGVWRVSGGELGPLGAERETDWGLASWENGSSVTAGLDWKKDIGEGIMVVLAGPPAAAAVVRVLVLRGGPPPAPAPPPPPPPAPPPAPPTKLSSSPALVATGSEAVTPKLSARLNPPPPPPGRNRGLAGLLFIPNTLKPGGKLNTLVTGKLL